MHSVSATRCNSPPERFFTSLSKSCSMFMGFKTSDWNCGCKYASLIFLCSKSRTVDSNLGEIFWGLYETLNSGRSSISSSSGLMRPAMRRMNVVLPVPFSPRRTMISVSVKSPASTVSLKSPCVLIIAG